MGLVCLTLVAMVGCGGGGGGGKSNPTQDMKEALKGKWYAHSFIPENGHEYNCYSSNDDKYYYLEIKEDNKYKFVAYDQNSIGIFIGDPFIYEGTWQFENPKLILTDNNKDTPIGIYNISLQDGILTTTHETYGRSVKFKKTPTPKYE